LSYYAALAVERVRLEGEAAHAELLREADRFKDAFLASVSHDLRTPLTTIKALATELATGGDERAYAICEEADRLNRLVAELLDLTRLRGGGFPIHSELNPVDDLVGAAIQRVSGILGGRPLTVSMADGGTLLVGRFDLGQSIRILTNLLENAHRYSPEGTPVELTARSEGDHLVLRCSTAAPGVPKEEQERIFEGFYRPAGAPPDAGAFGLGLAIARQLAVAQGGTLTYTPRPGGGSCFVLTLPAARLEPLAESL
jgi:two-component system sensor histidine kinase KdpD